jgi:hypothetical protein
MIHRGGSCPSPIFSALAALSATGVAFCKKELAGKASESNPLTPGSPMAYDTGFLRGFVTINQRLGQVWK